MNPKWTLWLSVLLCLCLLIPFGAVAEESGIDVEEEVVSESVEAASEELTVDLEGEDDPEEDALDEIILELTGKENPGNTFEKVMDAPLPELNSEDHQHDFDANGVCQECNTKKLNIIPTGSITITRPYGGDEWKELSSSEIAYFTITNLESGEDVHIIAAEARFSSENGAGRASLGSHTVEVEFEIDSDEWRYDYLCDTVTVNGIIIKRDVADSDVQVYINHDQSNVEAPPIVAVYLNSEKLILDTDYTLNYSYDNSTGVGMVTIKGIGNFEGTCNKSFLLNEENITDKTVFISLKPGHEPTKVYDRTINVSLSSSDFEISGCVGTDTVRISKMRASYDSRDAGDRKVIVTFEISQNSNQYNYVLVNDGRLTINGKITPRDMIVTPSAGQTKVYGAEDPLSFKGDITGLFKEDSDSVTGKLGRESGENVGEYKFTTGTLSAGSNYNVVIAQVNGKDVTFSITRKSISQVDVTLDPTTIPNQRWTGSEIKPAVSLKYNGMTLKEGTDYIVTYSDNVKAGMATMEFTGIGNYEGTRKTQFRILKAIEDMEYAPPTSIAINDTNKTLYIGYGRMLNVTMTTEDPEYLPDTVLTWKSDKPGIIAVDKSGKVTAKKVGTATITVTTANKLSASITMTVVDPFKPTDVSIEEPGFEYLGVKDSAQLNAILTSEKTPASAKLTWKSSASAVAGVDKNGKVTGKKPGTATITVTTDNKLSASVEIEVKDIHAPESIEIVPVSAEYIPVKGTLPLSVTMTAIAEPQTKLTWKSSKASVASVDRNGLVTGKKAGVVTITVTTGNKLSASVEIEVKDIHAPESIEIVPVSAEYIAVKEKLPLVAAMIAIAEPQTKLTWKSSKASVASVDKNGVVTGKKAGTATITVTTANKLSASIDVEVVDTHAPTAVRIVPETVAPISVKGTAQLSAEVEAIDMPTTRLTWKSDNPRVASVSSKGLVTGKKAGTATITVTTGNKLSASITIEVK